jgi:hypothetical protein
MNRATVPCTGAARLKRAIQEFGVESASHERFRRKVPDKVPEKRRCERQADPIFDRGRNAASISTFCPKGDGGVTDVTERDYYIGRAIEYALAAERVRCDRDVLLHMAATYVHIAHDIEMRRAAGITKTS